MLVDRKQGSYEYLSFSKLSRKIGLRANRFVAVEAIRGDMGWNTFEERMAKGRLSYRARLEMMDEVRYAKRVFM
jgi:hypothetical protein